MPFFQVNRLDQQIRNLDLSCKIFYSHFTLIPLRALNRVYRCLHPHNWHLNAHSTIADHTPSYSLPVPKQTALSSTPFFHPRCLLRRTWSFQKMCRPRQPWWYLSCALPTCRHLGGTHPCAVEEYGSACTCLTAHQNKASKLHLHMRAIVADFGSPLDKAINICIVREAFAVHDMVERRSSDGFSTGSCILRRTRETPFHSSLEPLARGGIVRHGCNCKSDNVGWCVRTIKGTSNEATPLINDKHG